MLQITHLKVWGYIWLEIVPNEDFLGPTPPPPPPPTPETHLLGRCEGSEMWNNQMLELHASNGQTHQSRPGSMVFPQFTKIPVTLVFNKTNSLEEKQKRTKNSTFK